MAKGQGGILLAGGVVLAVGLASDARSGRIVTTDALARRLFGFFAATFLLLAVSGPAPRLAKGLAGLMVITSLIVDGGELFRSIARVGDTPDQLGEGDPVRKSFLPSGNPVVRGGTGIDRFGPKVPDDDPADTSANNGGGPLFRVQ